MFKLTNLALFALTVIVGVAGLLAAANALNEQGTTSNATVNEYVAIGLSDVLAAGIPFGSLDAGTDDNNATGNNAGGATDYNITVSADTNINIDLCIKDNANLTSTGSTIPNVGYTWADNTTANAADMIPANSYSITTAYNKLNVTNIAKSTSDHFKFFLDIPASQAAGDYNNTVTFKGVKTATAC